MTKEIISRQKSACVFWPFRLSNEVKHGAKESRRRLCATLVHFGIHAHFLDWGTFDGREEFGPTKRRTLWVWRKGETHLN